MKFNIICNNILFKKIKDIDIFQLDLGKSLINRKENKLDIQDTFVEQYYSTTNRFALKNGKIGSIGIYVDIQLPSNVLLVDGDSKIYEVEYEDTGKSMKSYLSELLKSIEDYKIAADKELERIKEKNERWIANDSKNGNKSYEINQRLDRDSYADELLKKRKNG